MDQKWKGMICVESKVILRGEEDSAWNLVLEIVVYESEYHILNKDCKRAWCVG